MQTQDAHPHLTLVVTCWALIGPIVGLAVGNYFQTKGQRKQWQRDNVKQECREFLSSFSVHLLALADWNHDLEQANGPDGKADPEIHKRYNDAANDLYRTIGSRLLIAETTNGISKRWRTATQTYLKDNDDDKLEATYDEIRAIVVKKGLSV